MSQAGERVRVYVPLTWASLAEAYAAGELPPGVAYTVTPRVRSALGAAVDQEEAEYAALDLAAQACLALLVADPGVPDRRVVVACDVAPASVAVRDDAVGEVGLSDAVSWRRVAAVHVDEPAAAQAVAAARAHGDAESLGDVPLLWYVPGEVGDLVG